MSSHSLPPSIRRRQRILCAGIIYHVTDLGTLGGTSSEATAINDLGQVVGYATTTGNSPAFHAFYSGGSVTDLGTFGGPANSFAYGINNAGQIAGQSTMRPSLYSGGAMIGLGVPGGPAKWPNALRAPVPASRRESRCATKIMDVFQFAPRRLHRLAEQGRGPRSHCRAVPSFCSRSCSSTSGSAPPAYGPIPTCRRRWRSPIFQAQFSNTSELRLFDVLTSVCNHKSGGPLGTKEVELVDNNGSRHVFVFESFCYRYKQSDGSGGYQVLTLGVHSRKLSRVIVA